MADNKAWGAAGTKYKIHEETFRHFAQLDGKGTPAIGQAPPEVLRAVALRKSELCAGHADFAGSESEIIVPFEGSEGGIPVSVYKPAQTNPVPAILVYFHGGGLVIGSRTSHTTLLKILAKRAGCITINVEYRLAPEHKAPASFDDCRTAARWVLANKTRVGGQKGSQVGIGGDSAGGHLTASISHDVPGLAFQILIYPHTDLTLSAPSFSEFNDTPGLNTTLIHWFMSQYLANEGQKTDPVVSPYHRPSFSGLSPCLSILAELDPLRDDGQAYCKKLKEAGVTTEVLMVKGAPHGFFHLPAHFKELTKEPYDRCVKFLKSFQKA